MRRKILCASAKVFLEKGYAGASSKMVAELAGVSNGSPFYHYGNKEGVLLEFVRRMFFGQFQTATGLMGQSTDPLLLYAVETALQMHIVELSEPLRELYVTAYTLPSTSQYIHQNMVPKLWGIFGSFRAEAKQEDFYTLDLATAGITRSFMAEPCTEQFPLKSKIRRYLECCFRIFNVPQERFEPVIDHTVQMNLTAVAEHVIAETVRQAGESFDAVMTETPTKQDS